MGRVQFTLEFGGRELYQHWLKGQLLCYYYPHHTPPELSARVADLLEVNRRLYMGGPEGYATTRAVIGEVVEVIR